MATSLQKNENYLSPAKESSLLHDFSNITLIGTVVAKSASEQPRVSSYENGEASLCGKADVGLTTSLDMKLGTINGPFDSVEEMILPVTVVTTGGVVSTGYIQISGLNITVVGTPAASDVYHLNGLKYIVKDAV